MLKIKNDVNLKELEKFKFKKEKFYYTLNRCKHKDVELDGYTVDLETRKINNYTVSDNTLDVLYDLIQAGLIEKVVRRNK